MARSLERAVRGLRELGGEPEFAFFVPGRVEVLGKHTDYAGGRSLLAATEWGFAFVGRKGARRGELHLLDAGSGRDVRLSSGSSTFPGSGGPIAVAPPSDGWARYPAAVLRRVERDFPEAFPGKGRGVTVAFAGDLPPAAGMSSSSALVVGVFLSLVAGLAKEGASWGLDLQQGGGDPRSGGGSLGIEVRERWAAYLAAVEAGRPFPGLGGPGPGKSGLRGPGLRGPGLPAPAGVGTDGGSGDHTAILAARPGHLVRYGYLPTRFEGAVPLPRGWTFALASSGVRAEKAGGAREAYNRMAEEARWTARIWREETGGDEPHLGSILALSQEARTRLEEILGGGGHARLLARFRQFATECEDLIPGAMEALGREDLEAVGHHVARSQALAEEVLGNQVPETVHLAGSARELGAAAASAFGAGFGGAVWALLPVGEVEGFLHRWKSDYLARFPGRAGACAFLASPAGPPAFRIL